MPGLKFEPSRKIQIGPKIFRKFLSSFSSDLIQMYTINLKQTIAKSSMELYVHVSFGSILKNIIAHIKGRGKFFKKYFF